MKRKEINQIREWIQCWQSAGVELEKVRKEQIRNANTPLAIEQLDDAFCSALRLFKPKPTSGLVELERWLHRLGGKS